MTIIIEVSGPFQAKPGFFRSRLMARAWWLWLAVGWLRVPFKEYCEADKQWVMSGGDHRVRL